MKKPDRLLSVGDVARQLGLSEDVVRSLMDSGELKTVRTPGGHRRCAPEEVKQFKARGGRRGPGQVAKPRPSTPPKPPEYVEEEITLQEYEAELEREAARERARAEAERLEGWRKYGREYARRSLLPSDWFVLVVEDLETFVSTTRIPPTLQAWEAQLIVQARVDSLVRQYRQAEDARVAKEREAVSERQRVEAERARAESERREKERRAAEQLAKEQQDAAEQLRKQQEAERRVKDLIDHGKHYAWLETFANSDFSDAERARRDVERALREEVKADWSEAEVDDLVDDVLCDGEEQDENDEEDESW